MNCLTAHTNQAKVDLASRRAVLVSLYACILALSGLGSLATSGPEIAQNSPAQSGENVRPLPRFASLRASRVNLRRGPGTDYPTAWVFRRAGLPVEIIKEFESWRQARDSEGTTGWVLRTLLSKRRTALILPWEIKADRERPLVILHRTASSRSNTVVQVEAGVIANIQTCDGRWCSVIVDDFKGYVMQNQLWGVYADEVIQ